MQNNLEQVAAEIYLLNKDKNDVAQVVLYIISTLKENSQEEVKEVLNTYNQIQNGDKIIILIETPAKINDKDFENIKSKVLERIEKGNYIFVQKIDTNRNDIEIKIGDKELILNK